MSKRDMRESSAISSGVHTTSGRLVLSLHKDPSRPMPVTRIHELFPRPDD